MFVVEYMEDIENLYGELFDLFYNSKWADDELAAFKMQVGDNYENGPLFVGRAPKGWTPFCPSEWDKDDFSQDPMLPGTDFSDWLANRYNIFTSNFWTDSKRIFDGLYNGNFFTDIAYSNLCKIARPNGNPTDKQCGVQLSVCRKILLAEITELEPECIVFLTGYYGWAEWFFDDWDEVTVDNVSPDEVIKCSGEIAGCPFVVIHHPGYKSNDERDNAINAVVEYFQEDDDDSYDDDCCCDGGDDENQYDSGLFDKVEGVCQLISGVLRLLKK